MNINIRNYHVSVFVKVEETSPQPPKVFVFINKLCDRGAGNAHAVFSVYIFQYFFLVSNQELRRVPPKYRNIILIFTHKKKKVNINI